MKKIKQVVYQANDGAIFKSEVEAKAHEDKLEAEEKTTTWWMVIHNPDTTEGRGHGARTYIKLLGIEYLAREWIEDWCFTKFGRRLDFCQGVAAMTNWEIFPSNRKDWALRQPQRLGDYDHAADCVVLERAGTGLVLKASEEAQFPR